MIVGIYSRPDGAYLLVPDCMTASAEAQRLHGPLKFVELMDWSEDPLPEIWETVIAELDAHSFVVLQDATVKFLLETEANFRV